MSKLLGGTVHDLPIDFEQVLLSDSSVTALWQDITPLARNEWICWVISGARAETRTKRMTVGLSKMQAGERRPCCWIGCIHRTDKDLSPSVREILGKRQKNK